MTFYTDLLALVESQIENRYTATLSDLGEGKPYHLSLESLLKIRASLSTSSGGNHPDTDNYLSRLALTGGTISAPNITLLDTKIRQLYTDGLRGSTNYLKYWLCLNLTDSFAGCFVPVYDDGVGNAVNHNFVSGDWSSTGLTGNGGNKYLQSNWNPATSLGTFSNAGRCDVHVAAWVKSFNSQAGDGDTGVLGGGNGFDSYIELYTTSNTSTTGVIFSNGAAAGVGSQTNGFHLLNRPSNASLRLVINGSVATDTNISNPIVNPNYTIPLFALDDPIGSIGYYSRAKISDFTMGKGLTPTQETALYNALALT